jgi:hypothetical protein
MPPRTDVPFVRPGSCPPGRKAIRQTATRHATATHRDALSRRCWNVTYGIADSALENCQVHAARVAPISAIPGRRRAQLAKGVRPSQVAERAAGPVAPEGVTGPHCRLLRVPVVHVPLSMAQPCGEVLAVAGLASVLMDF